jgi:hypothetical protein
MNKTLTFIGAAGFLLLGIGCGSSEPSDEDASIAHDAQLAPDGARMTGGSSGSGGTLGGSGGIVAVDGAMSTGGMTGVGGAVGSGGIVGLDGGSVTGGATGTGGAIGTGGNAIDGGSGIDAGTGGAGIDGAADLVCGGIAGLPCPTGQFCEYPQGQCSSIADGTGVCEVLTQVCIQIHQPVCGCDGKTYGNDCIRRGAGVSKLHDGECSGTGKMCGGIAGFACDNGQFCDLTPGDCGTIADGAGTCAATGTGIACDKVYRPVCGCDGNTYGNDCERQVAGVSKRADGACSVDAGTSG